MATIEKRTAQDGSISYRVKVRLKGHPVQSASFPRLTDAKRWAASTESAIKEGRHFQKVEAKRHTVADLIDRYQRDELSKRNQRARDDRAPILAWWRESIGVRLLADVTPALIAEHRDRLINEGRANATACPGWIGCG